MLTLRPAAGPQPGSRQRTNPYLFAKCTHEPANTEGRAAAFLHGPRPRHSCHVAVLSIILAMQIALGLLIGFVEGWSFGDAIYFTFVTGLTIGYGDIVPRQG